MNFFFLATLLLTTSIASANTKYLECLSYDWVNYPNIYLTITKGSIPKVVKLRVEEGETYRPRCAFKQSGLCTEYKVSSNKKLQVSYNTYSDGTSDISSAQMHISTGSNGSRTYKFGPCLK